MVSYKKGDKVKIISNSNGNGFSDSEEDGIRLFGEIVTLKKRDTFGINENGEDWICEEYSLVTLRSIDFQLVTESSEIIEIW